MKQLQDLCLQNLYKTINNLNVNYHEDFGILERVFLFERFQMKKQLNTQVLRFLSSSGPSSEYFLDNNRVSDFSSQPLTDDSIQYIQKLLPNCENGKMIALEIDNCLKLEEPIINSIDEPLPILSLSLRGCKLLKSLTFLPFLCSSSCLQYLDLSFCRNITSKQIGTIGNHFKLLNSFRYCGTIEENDLINLMGNNINLRELVIINGKKLTDKTLECMRNNKMKISKLHLSSTYRITAFGFLAYLVDCGNSLQTFTLPSEAYNPWTLLSLPYLCQSLNSLIFYRKMNMNWMSLLRYPTKDELDKHVTISDDNSDESNEIFDYWKSKIDRIFNGLSINEQENAGKRFLGSLKTLKLIDLSNTWNNIVAADILECCSSLTYLSIRKCSTISEDVFEAINTSKCELKILDYGYTTCNKNDDIGILKCESLRSIDANSSMSNSTIKKWISQTQKSCRYLNSFSAQWSDSLNDDGMILLCERAAESLEYVELRLCYFLTEKTFLSMAQYCSNINHLDVSSVSSVNNNAITAICHGCPHITYLNISHNEKITNEAIKIITEKLYNLKTFLVDNLIQLSDESILYLANLENSLKVLSIAGIRNFTDNSLISLQLYNYNIRTLNLASTRFSTFGLINFLNQMSISSLNLSMQPHVTNEVVQSATNYEYIEELVRILKELSQCENLNNDCIIYLERCRCLNLLNLSDSNGITGKLNIILDKNRGNFSLTLPNGNLLFID